MLHNYNCVLTCGAKCNSFGGGKKRSSFFTQGPREGCSLHVTRFYTVRSFVTETNYLPLELKNKYRCFALV